MSILIKNGRIITATDDYLADIFIEGETISSIGKNINVKADKEIDASGKLVFPGGIDPHTHMELPFGGTHASDDFLRVRGRRCLGDNDNNRFRGADRG